MVNPHAQLAEHDTWLNDHGRTADPMLDAFRYVSARNPVDLSAFTRTPEMFLFLLTAVRYAAFRPRRVTSPSSDDFTYHVDITPDLSRFDAALWRAEQRARISPKFFLNPA